jgi:hypothetical protein
MHDACVVPFSGPLALESETSMAAKCAYVEKVGAVYYVHKRIPRAWSGRVEGEVVRMSLRTKDRATAIKRGLEALAVFEELLRMEPKDALTHLADIALLHGQPVLLNMETSKRPPDLFQLNEVHARPKTSLVPEPAAPLGKPAVVEAVAGVELTNQRKDAFLALDGQIGVQVFSARADPGRLQVVDQYKIGAVEIRGHAAW